MFKYFLKRLAQMVVTLFIVSILVFVLANFIGDPVNMLVSPKAPPEVREQVREELGLNRPILEQYVSFVTNAFKGDFGKSYIYKVDALSLIAQRVPATLELRDEEGNAFTPQYISMDSDSANVTLTVYQVRELPLEVDFIGAPNGFDVESLHYSLSQQTLCVAGPARTISALEALTVTDFDLAREFEPGRDYQRLIELPAGIVSLDGVTNVTLDFDTSEMASTKLNVSNIRAINVPSNYELQILSSIVSGVTLYGPADEIEKLSADSIVAQIDCQSLNLTVGQQTIAVSIQIPSSSRIFATGSYTVQCEVTSK
mgnify:CR=1 FL=1